jgi:putative protease
MITSKPELLAPAGERSAFLAALSAGADAIYLGAGEFNARRNAANFSFEELQELCDLAHIAGRRVYLTLNTLVLPDEVTRALELANKAWEVGVDALIVQDIGLLMRLAREMPQCELHASTQMNLHNSAAVRLVAELGAARVTLARELSLDEIGAIAREGVPLEVFAHGALCVCYSGQCLFSSLVGRRSANRGLCAQACRLPYHLIDTSTGRRIKTTGDHLLSPADLATIDILPRLVRTGIASLKIEGRMKSAAYVAAVTRAYRQALDALDLPAASAASVAPAASAASAGDGSLSTPPRPPVAPATPAAPAASQPPLSASLAETFSRGFTTAYLEGERGNSMMSYTRPNNQGVAIGRVGALTNGLVAVDLTRRVLRGDVLEFRTSRGRAVTKLDDFWPGAKRSEAGLESSCEGSRIYLRVAEPVSMGDRVFRVRSAELLGEVESSFDNTVFQANRGLVALDARVIARRGEPLTLSFGVQHNGHCREVTVCGDRVEAARTRALSSADVREHIGRVGETPFFIRSWDIQLDEGVGMGFSTLHRLRTEALQRLTDDLLQPWRTRRITPREAPAALAPARRGRPRIAAIVCDEAGARAAVGGGAELIYLHSLRFEARELPDESAEDAAGGVGGVTSADAEDGTPGTPGTTGTTGASAECGADTRAGHGADTALPSVGRLAGDLPVIRLLPTIVHDGQFACVEAVARAGESVVVGNLGELEVLRRRSAPQASSAPFAPPLPEAGPSLGIYNAETLEALARLGVTQAWLSPELSRHDIARLSPASPLPLALSIFGCQEVMVTEHCILMAQGPCDRRCASCARRKAPRLLVDRKGYRFPVRTDDFGRSHLFNAVPLDLIPAMPELVSLGLSTLVVDGTLLTTKELKAELIRARHARDLALKGAGSLPKRQTHTTGHFYRGVL